MISVIYEKFSVGMMPDRSALDMRVAKSVSDIVQDVRENGDEALYRLSEKFDGARPESIEVPTSEIEAAIRYVGAEFMKILESAAENIRSFHKKQVREGFIYTKREGVILGQRIIPLESAGVYAPGGTAAYPSTVLMDAIPASIAGVERIILCTPPSVSGSVAAPILAAASVAGITNVYRVGGAQAIAAMAYGTKTVPAVDKIVGPGNVYVQEAKKQVFGKVGIDMIAGPSEILIIADSAADARYVAADMLSQAEHDKNSAAILVTDSARLAAAVAVEIESQVEKLERRDIAKASIDTNGRIFIADSILEAAEISNKIAPEHLEICTQDPFSVLPLVKNAGSVFLGNYCPEALGDYYAGPNHTLPTVATARYASPLGVDDFVKRSSYTYYTKQALMDDALSIEKFAESEGLTAHARSVSIRREGI